MGAVKRLLEEQYEAEFTEEGTPSEENPHLPFARITDSRTAKIRSRRVPWASRQPAPIHLPESLTQQQHAELLALMEKQAEALERLSNQLEPLRRIAEKDAALARCRACGLALDHDAEVCAVELAMYLR